MSFPQSKIFPKIKLFQITLILLALPILSACSLEEKKANTISDFHKHRSAEIAAMRQFRSCADEGKTLDQKARMSGGSGAYLASANVLKQCEAEIHPSHNSIATEERMQAYALAIQNYVKGRDITSARAALKKFKIKFSGKDFYYPDGTSFILTMETLLGMHDEMSFGQFSSLNISKTLKKEMRRLHYWKNK